MQLKLNSKRISTIAILVFFSVLFMAVTAFAADLTVGSVTGDVVTATTTDNITWNATVTRYSGISPSTSINLGGIAGSGFTAAAGTTGTYSTTGGGWAIDQPPTIQMTTGAFSGGSLTLLGSSAAPAALTLTLTDNGGPTISANVTFNFTFVEGKLTPVLDPTSLNFTTGKNETKSVEVKSLSAGTTDIPGFTLSKIEVFSGGTAVTEWNDLAITTSTTAKTITFKGIALNSMNENLTVRMTSDSGTVKDVTLPVSATPEGTAGLTLTPNVLRFYLGDPAVSKTTTVAVTPADHGMTALTVSPTSWNGLTLTADLATKSITVSGKPTVGPRAVSVDVTATTFSGAEVTTGLTLAVLDQSSIKRFDEDTIGIWNYANVAMKAAELIYYKPFSANTGYNPRGKYDLLFFCDSIIDGDKISVHVKEPGQSNFSPVTWLTTSNIPLEGWAHVDKTTPSSPYGDAPAARGSGTSLGWYRTDVDTASGTMTVAVNSQPNAAGEYTFRIDYAYTDAYGLPQSNSQEFKLNATGSGSGGSGGCDAGLGAAVLLAAGAAAALLKRGRK